MANRTAKLMHILLMTLAPIFLLLAVCTIWEIIDLAVAKDALMKILYTYAVIFVVSLGMIWLKASGERQK